MQGANAAQIPTTIGGVATVVLPASGPSGEAATSLAASQPRAASLGQMQAVKQKNAASLLKSNPALFGVGVGQSRDNPGDAALILFVDRKKFSGKLPESIEGQRVRTILMDRLHVTRSHGTPARSAGNCFSARHLAPTAEDEVNLPDRESLHFPELFENQLQLPD